MLVSVAVKKIMAEAGVTFTWDPVTTYVKDAMALELLNVFVAWKMHIA